MKIQKYKNKIREYINIEIEKIQKIYNKKNANNLFLYLEVRREQELLVMFCLQMILNFPQRDCLGTRKVSKLHNYTVWRAIDCHFPYLCLIIAINCQ